MSLLGALSGIGSIFSFLSKLMTGLFGFAIYRAGETKQAHRDEQATDSAIERERDALAQAGGAKDAAKRGEF